MAQFEGGPSSKSVVHTFYYLGVVQLSLGIQRKPEKNDDHVEETGVTENEEIRSVEERIIDQLDHAQLCGEIIRQPKEDTKLVTVEISTNGGVKFVSISDQRVVERLAMHKIVQCLSYENEIGSYNVAICCNVSNDTIICHLLQNENANTADELCEQISETFQTFEHEATSKTRDDREKRRNELEQKRRLRKNPTTQ